MMPFQKSYSAVFKGVTPEQVWAIWSDLEKRPLWDDDTERVKLETAFKVGGTFLFKPKNDKRSIRITITECTPNRSFTDTCKLPLARLEGIHEVVPVKDGVKITTTIIIKGPLRWLWQKLIGEQIVASLPHQTEMLVKLAKHEK